jgi:hypothetical protein
MAPVCNEVFRNDTSDPSDKDKECACPTGTTYCPSDNTCKKPGEVCTASICNALTVSTGTVIAGSLQG